jgi:hypothetical protein
MGIFQSLNHFAGTLLVTLLLIVSGIDASAGTETGSDHMHDKFSTNRLSDNYTTSIQADCHPRACFF